MHGLDFFFQAFVYLLAAVVSVPVAKRLGFGSVLGYLAAGVLIGPVALGLVGAEGQDVMHFAEFGVVMMLFLVGLELRPTLLWRLRTPIVGMGGVSSGRDAVEMIMAGATAVGIGSAVYVEGPEAFGRIRDEMAALMAELGYDHIDDMLGVAHRDD